MLKEEEIVGGTKIKWKGTFDLGLLYNKMKNWLVVESYGEPTETLYVERIKPEGRNVEVAWESSKVEEDYFKPMIKILIRANNMQDVEIVRDGKKLTLQKGMIELQISSSLGHDAEGRFKDSPNWGKFYSKHFMADNIDKNQIELYDKTLDLIDLVKDFLSMYAF